MKKSEKIEIRVSPEEKEQLSKRAEAEGRPVSEIVRQGLGGDGFAASGVSHGQTGRRLSTLEGFGALALSFVAGSAMSFLLTAAHPARDPIEEWDASVQLRELKSAPVNTLNSSFVLPNEAGAEAEVFLSSGPDQGYIVRGRATAGPGQEVIALSFEICRKDGEDCEPLFSPYVISTPDRDIVLRGATPGELEYFLTLSAPRDDKD